jgi:hypothetical protein
MKRSNIISLNSVFPLDSIKRASFHEAGHAAAIYLYNRQKKLPPVYFSIKFKLTDPMAENQNAVRIEGGRLIQALPTCTDDFLEFLAASSEEVQDAYCLAFDADIVNLLCGPLAEAKYTAYTKGKKISGRGLNASALINDFGGAHDVRLINAYLNSRFDHKAEKRAKLAELTQLACAFLNQAKTWRAISDLAEHLRNSSKRTIECEEAIAVINRSLLSAPPMQRNNFATSSYTAAFA